MAKPIILSRDVSNFRCQSISAVRLAFWLHVGVVWGDDSERLKFWPLHSFVCQKEMVIEYSITMIFTQCLYWLSAASFTLFMNVFIFLGWLVFHFLKASFIMHMYFAGLRFAGRDKVKSLYLRYFAQSAITGFRRFGYKILACWQQKRFYWRLLL